MGASMKPSSISWDETSRPLKRAAVERAMTMARLMLSSDAPVANALLMPAGQWECARTAIGVGLISREGTRVTAVERDDEVYPEMVSNAHRLGMAASMRPVCLRKSLCDVACPPEGYVFSFLDFCAFIDTESAAWVYGQFAPALPDGAVVMFTMASDQADRHSGFPRAAREFFTERRPDLLAPLVERRYDNGLQAIGDECAVVAATAQALLAPAGTVKSPLVLRPYRDEARQMTVVVCQVSRGQRGDTGVLPAILDLLPPFMRAQVPDIPVSPNPEADEYQSLLERLDENQRASEQVTAVLARLNAEVTRHVAQLTALGADESALIAQLKSVAPAAVRRECA
jgi:hypothetical protein